MKFKERIQRRYGLSDEAVEIFLHRTEPLAFGRKQTVVREGMRDDYIYFIEHGSVRGYVEREEHCVILFFGFEGDIASLLPGDTGSTTAHYSVDTMEPTTLLRIPRAEMELLFASSAELANWGRRIAERWVRINQEYFADYAWREKGAQYELLLREYPELLQRVPLKDLAAYLFITPQTLSRIRAAVK